MKSFILVFCIILSYNCLANLPKTPKKFDVSNFNLTGTALTGLPLTLATTINPDVSDTLIRTINLRGNIGPSDTCENCVSEIRDTIVVDSGNVINDTFNIKVWSQGNGFISQSISSINRPGVSPFTLYRYVNIITADTTYKIIHYNQNDSIIKRDTNYSIAYEVTRHYNLSGRVRFTDTHQGNQYRAPWTTPVQAWFIKYNNGTQTYSWRPALSSGSYEAKCDIDGNFIIDFTIDSELDPSPNITYKLELRVVKGNDAMALDNNGGALVMQTNTGTIPTFPGGESVIMDVDKGTYNDFRTNILIDINSLDGEILRNSIMAYKFLQARYNNYYIPKIIINRRSLNNNWAGVFETWYWNFQCRHSITIDDDCTEATVVEHEYGHYVHFDMSGSDCGDWADFSDASTEGWAMFFSFAARSWANNMFNEDLLASDDNLEAAPFSYSGTTRFSGLRYSDQPDFCKFACYLWNIYDSYSEDSFMPSNYDHSNNDDVIGLGNRVFNIMDLQSGDEPSDFHNDIKNYGSGVDNNLKPSIDDIWDFMYDNNQQNPAPMRPAQVRKDRKSVV